MFVRKKKNRSGSTSVVVADKSSGRFKELVTIGVGSDPEEIERLCIQGKEWIDRHKGQLSFDFLGEDLKVKELEQARGFISSIESVLMNGAKMIFDRVYDSVGFNRIEDEELRQLVIARLCEPMSKRATVDYLRRHFVEDVYLHRIYRYMDKLYNTQRELVQQISVEHTFKVLGGRVEILFYDVTSLYFESFLSDELRSPGFSKDGKTAETQIILGLLVCEHGYPLSYSIFNGAQYEGYTMIPIIDDFKQRFKLDDFVVVADSGFMTNKNIELLRKAGYKFIVGARIKKAGTAAREWMLSLPHRNGECHEMKLDNGDRLVVSYSQTRADKDAYNRRRGVERLRKNFASGKVTKDKLNKRGYNKFLRIDNDVKVVIDQDKIREDEKWDGLKGYLTNTDLSRQAVIEQYHGLWQVERAFRISKGTLEARPIFHFTEKRIEAHICICFVAYKVYKELERLLYLFGLEMSVDTVIKIAKTITTIQLKLPLNGTTLTQTLLLNPEQRLLQPLLEALGLPG